MAGQGGNGAVKVKICGIRTPDALSAAVRYGADMVGFVFFPKSPRNVSVEEAAMLAARVPPHVVKVGLFVNPDDGLIERVLKQVPLDMLQLHGAEPPERAAELKDRTGRLIMKALPVRSSEDLDAAGVYSGVADMLLFDAKPPEDADRPGGNALAFDWTLLEGRRFDLPWLLAGGLTPDNVAGAIRLTGAPGVDTSSGVEDGPGVKNVEKIRRFVEAARNAR